MEKCWASIYHTYQLRFSDDLILFSSDPNTLQIKLLEKSSENWNISEHKQKYVDYKKTKSAQK